MNVAAGRERLALGYGAGAGGAALLDGGRDCLVGMLVFVRLTKMLHLTTGSSLVAGSLTLVIMRQSRRKR